MSMAMPSSVFLAAMQRRIANHPFDRISAYKIRECRDNLQRNLHTVTSIADYLCARRSERHPSMLVGCTEEDMGYRLKRVPEIVADELGYNLIPAVKALALEGVPAVDINLFIRTIKPQIDRLLADCDAVQTVTARSIKPEYAALKAGYSPTEQISANALCIAEKVVEFCNWHGV